MSSSFTGYLAARDHPDRKQPRPAHQSHLPGDSLVNHYSLAPGGHPITPADSHLLSPHSSAHVLSSNASPDAFSYTPNSALGIAPTGDFVPELSDDQFFNASFDNVGVSNTPSFLGEEFVDFGALDGPIPFPDFVTAPSARQAPSYPISPDKTPVTNTYGVFASTRPAPSTVAHPIILHQAVDQSAPQSVDSSHTAPQLTPDTNDGGWSGDENQVQYASLDMISPRVTVSEWETGGRPSENNNNNITNNNSSNTDAAGLLGSPFTVTGPRSAAGDFAGNYEGSTFSGASRIAYGSRRSSSSGDRQGIAPGQRLADEVDKSINQQTAQREVEDANKGVQAWVTRSRGASFNRDYIENQVPEKVETDDDNVSPREIPLGDQTVNRLIEGQMYYNEGARGPANETDINIIRGTMPWETGLRMQPIQTERTVPETAQQAIYRLQRQQQFDNASMLSRAATWGTRRHSLPSQTDVEGVLNGNFLKKLSIGSRDNSHVRRPSLISRGVSLVRKTSTRKRHAATTAEASSEQSEQPQEPLRRESKDSLAPPSRSPSWGFNKKSVPSLDTAIFGMSAGAAAIGSTKHHARHDSVSATSVTSPKSPFGGFSALGVPPIKNTLRRPRSKTDLGLVGLFKKTGGPPVVQPAKSRTKAEAEDDEDDADDDEDEDTQLELPSGEDIIPTIGGFKNHILRLNPGMVDANGVVRDGCRSLLDRTAHLMVVRYKALCDLKVKHIQQANARKCPNGTMCFSLGGTARILEARAETRGEDDSPVDALTRENFPTGIPMPPTTSLPAEFECQLCFAKKKFTKPSDWTKHVHEDVAPFNCTWDRCRDAKLFKRKADWVRHENEGHRHLEWWTCDVDDCRHVCYRRDNFLQHLVREHKFPEPTVKTKADIRRAGNSDLTCSKVEQCHAENDARPSDEPCRFCEKTFPTWKKLTVHLAKHMEHISLPVLDLVAKRVVDADTIISPVSAAPPQNYGSFHTPQDQVKQEPQSFPMTDQFVPAATNDLSYSQHHDFALNMAPPTTYSQPIDTTYYPDPGFVPQQEFMVNPMPNTMPHAPYQVAVTHDGQFAGAGSYGNMPNPEMGAFPDFRANSLGIQGAPIQQPMMYDGLIRNQNGNTMHQAVPQYSHQGSASPYSRSPHQDPMGYYGQ